MRRVYYDVEGIIFSSYREAMQFKAITEELENRSVTMTSVLVEESVEDTKARQEHRAKVEEILLKKFAAVM